MKVLLLRIVWYMGIGITTSRWLHSKESRCVSKHRVGYRQEVVYIPSFTIVQSGCYVYIYNSHIAKAIGLLKQGSFLRVIHTQSFEQLKYKQLLVISHTERKGHLNQRQEKKVQQVFEMTLFRGLKRVNNGWFLYLQVRFSQV